MRGRLRGAISAITGAVTPRSRDHRRPRDDFNNGWLSVVRPLLPYLFAFFFPDVHQAMDRDRPSEFLDKVMQ